MSTHARLSPSLAALTFLVSVLSGCLEYETTTTVHRDGSFTRSLTISGDSTGLTSRNFKVPVDSTWTIGERTKTDDKKWTMTADRTFSSADAWSVWKDSLTRRVLDCTIRIESDFRFFTTRYSYSETIHAYNPFTLVPLSDYISPSELDMFLRVEVMKKGYPSRGDSLALDDAGDRFEEWEARTRAASLFAVIDRHLASSSRLDQERREAFKESLVEYFMEEGSDKNYSLDGLQEWARGTRERDVIQAVNDGSEELLRLKEDMDWVQSVGSDSYASRVTMPGEIVRTNGIQDGPSSVSWDNYIAYAYVADFTMEAESSVVNAWAIVLTLGVITGVPALVWLARARRMRSGGQREEHLNNAAR